MPIPAGGQGGGTGGEGYVVLESTSTSSSSPIVGTAEWYNGERGKLYNDNTLTVLVFWI